MSPSDELLVEYGIRCGTHGPEDADTLQVLSNLVAALIREGRYDEALIHSGPLVAVRTRVLGARSAGTLKSRRNRSLALGLSGRITEALAEATELLPTSIHALGLHHPVTDLVRGDVARWRESLGLGPERVPRPPAAAPPPRPAPEEPVAPGGSGECVQHFDAARDSGVQIRMTDANSEDGWTPEERRAVYKAAGLDYRVIDLELRAQRLADAGRFAEALKVVDEVIPRLRTVYARDGRNIFRARLLRAECLRGLGRTRGAARALADLLADAQATLGDGASLTNEIKAALAFVELQAGDNRAAAEHLDELADHAKRVRPDGESPRLLLEIRAAAAVARAESGDWLRAYEELAAVLREAQFVVAASDPWLLRLRYSLASALGKSGDIEGGILLMRAVADDMEGALGALDRDTRDTREVLALMLRQNGDPDEARALLESVRDQALEADGPSSRQAAQLNATLRSWGPRRRFPFGPG